MMKTIFLCLALVPVLLWPQPLAETPTPETVTKIIRVHNARPEKLVELVRPGTPATISANDALKAIVVRGKPSDVAALERTIRELDSASTTAASRNVELMVYMLSGSNAQPASSTAADKLPALAPVVKQLRAIFPYSDYQLLSTMLLRSGEGTKTSTNGLLKSFQSATGQNGVGSNYPTRYSVQYDSATVSPDEASPSIHLERFRFDAHLLMEISSSQVQNYDIGIQTDVDLREGQKVVVGKSNIESTDSALFVILAARLVQ